MFFGPGSEYFSVNDLSEKTPHFAFMSMLIKEIL